MLEWTLVQKFQMRSQDAPGHPGFDQYLPGPLAINKNSDKVETSQ